MGNFKTSNIKVYKTNLKLISFSSLYVQNPKIKKKSLFFLGFQINKRRNDKITYKKKNIKNTELKKKEESKDVPAVAVKLPTFMFLKKPSLPPSLLSLSPSPSLTPSPPPLSLTT